MWQTCVRQIQPGKHDHIDYTVDYTIHYTIHSTIHYTIDYTIDGADNIYRYQVSRMYTSLPENMYQV